MAEVFPLLENSLIVLTGTLGATTTWLALRLLAASAIPGHASRTIGQLEKLSPTSNSIILISWLQDAETWKDGGRKLVGIARVMHHDIKAESTGRVSIFKRSPF